MSKLVQQLHALITLMGGFYGFFFPVMRLLTPIIDVESFFSEIKRFTCQICRAAVNRIVNLTESTIASGDDEGCIKVKFHKHTSENSTRNSKFVL